MKSLAFYHPQHIRANEQIGQHEHPEWELSLVAKGTGIRIMGIQKEPFECGEVVLVPPNLSHCWNFNDEGEEVESITVLFSSRMLNAMATSFPEMEELTQRLTMQNEATRFKGKTQCLLAEIMKRMDGESDAERIVSLLQMLIIMGNCHEKQTVGYNTNRQSESKQRLKRIETFIKCNYNHNISIDDIARHIGMNRSALCTFFKHHTGITLITYLNRHRMEVAKNLLRHYELTIQEICYESGFCDLPYFCRLFRKNEGMSPGEYRKLL